MMKSIIEMIIIIVITVVLNFNKKIALVGEKMDLFYRGIEESSISYKLDNEVFLVFDYEYIKEIANVTFKGFEVYIDKKSDCYFIITVLVEEKFLNKEIKEEIYLKKGDIYD